MKAALTCATILLATVIYAADEPSMKEGLWLIHSQVVEHPTEQKTADATATICRDAAYDKRVREASMPKGCRLIDKTGKSSATVIKFEAQCKYLGAKLKATEIIEITGDTISHTVTNTTVTPPASGVSGMTAIADMKYLGSCPAGMKPGDALLPDGTFAAIPLQ
jgi:hypothetical protein